MSFCERLRVCVCLRRAGDRVQEDPMMRAIVWCAALAAAPLLELPRARADTYDEMLTLRPLPDARTVAAFRFTVGAEVAVGVVEAFY